MQGWSQTMELGHPAGSISATPVDGMAGRDGAESLLIAIAEIEVAAARTIAAVNRGMVDMWSLLKSHTFASCRGMRVRTRVL